MKREDYASERWECNILTYFLRVPLHYEHLSQLARYFLLNLLKQKVFLQLPQSLLWCHSLLFPV